MNNQKRDTQMTTEYNGWTNWETWNIANWIDDDYSIYMCRCNYVTFEPWNVTSVKSFIRDMFPNGTPDFANSIGCNTSSDYWDEVVNYDEIADAWNSEYKEDDYA
jgi:hypothetical protein|tara:strand:+ start:409 stop:723 length:315 start_codon:yes stop_codon:yes gene_type:complete